MTSDSDKKNTLKEDNDNLVKALESIKSLLATSEDKLNKARESIDQASSFSLRDDQAIPLLEDIVVPGNELAQGELLDLDQALAETTEHADQLIQQLDEEEQMPEPDSIKPAPTGPDPAVIAQFQQALENEMQAKLQTYATELEQELKDRIAAFMAEHTDK